MVDRLLGALKGDVATYEEVEHDRSATVQAAIIVVIAAVLGGAGAALQNSISDSDTSAGQGFFVGLIAALLGWLVWAAATHWVGSTFFGATSTVGEMLRVIGFAHVVLWFTILPFVGWIAALWFLYVAFKAIRAGLDISTSATVIVIVIGLIIRVIANILPFL